MSEVKKKEEDWMTSKWRPMMAIVYMAINVFDFILVSLSWVKLMGCSVAFNNIICFI